MEAIHIVEKSCTLPLRLRKPTETIRQLICFAPLFKLLISADTSRNDSMINLYTWNRYTIRHIEFDLQYRFPTQDKAPAIAAVTFSTTPSYLEPFRM